MGNIARVYRRKSGGWVGGREGEGQRVTDSTLRCAQDDPLEARTLTWQWNTMETHGQKQLCSM